MTPAEESQAKFEALFPEGHTPKTDTRTPQDLKDERNAS
jgi:hypothetical protein